MSLPSLNFLNFRIKFRALIWPFLSTLLATLASFPSLKQILPQLQASACFVPLAWNTLPVAIYMLAHIQPSDLSSDVISSVVLNVASVTSFHHHVLILYCPYHTYICLTNVTPAPLPHAIQNVRPMRAGTKSYSSENVLSFGIFIILSVWLSVFSRI